jgi:hypothetical protein
MGLLLLTNNSSAARKRHTRSKKPTGDGFARDYFTSPRWRPPPVGAGAGKGGIGGSNGGAKDGEDLLRRFGLYI